jgi:hypothetical protein
MRWQGYLHLVAARRESGSGTTRDRAAAAHLTLALRHYDKALSPSSGNGGGGGGHAGAMTDAMAACVASCRLDLASFFLTWDAPVPAQALPAASPLRGRPTSEAKGSGVTTRRGPAGMGGGRSKHLEAALAHARAGLEVIRPLMGAATADTGGGSHGARGRETGAGGGRETAVGGGRETAVGGGREIAVGGGRETAAELASQLGNAAERAVRMLIRAADGAGGGAPSAALRDEYRQLLAERRVYESAAPEAGRVAET